MRRGDPPGGGAHGVVRDVRGATPPQGSGVGKALQAAAEEHARAGGATTMELCVIDRRAELIAWYERRGYVLHRGDRARSRTASPASAIPRDPDFRFAVLAKPLG